MPQHSTHLIRSLALQEGAVQARVAGDFSTLVSTTDVFKALWACWCLFGIAAMSELCDMGQLCGLWGHEGVFLCRLFCDC
jgi:hypothetical protein